MRERRFFIGCDVSKGHADFLVLDSDLTPVEIKGSSKSFKLDDTPGGHRILGEVIKDLNSEQKAVEIIIGFESTGGYENNWINYLQNLGEELNLKIVRLNGYKVHNHSKAKMDEVITDSISAYNIAEYMVRYNENLKYLEKDIKAEKYLELGKEFKFAVRRQNQASKAIGELETMLVTTNPGMLSQWPDKNSKWFYRVLIKYPTARCLAEATLNEITSIPYVGQKKGKELIQIGKSTAPNSCDSERQRMMIREICKEILTKKNRKEKIIDYLATQVDQEDLRLLKSIPYFGKHTAVGICLEIVDMEKFPSSKHFVSYLGLHPKIKKSGDGQKKPKMSKKGSKVARSLLYLAVMRMIGNDTYFNELYNEYLDKGKGKGCTIGILMHKLARIIYGILKNKEPYNSEIDKNNRANKKNKDIDSQEAKLNEIKRSRRLQDESKYAPVSNRERKKRKKRRKSQEALASCARSSSTSYD